MAIPQDANQRWSLDFVSDAIIAGRRFPIRCIIDDVSSECLATVANNRLLGERVARELDAIAERRRYPCMVTNYNGPELTSNTMLALATGSWCRVALHRARQTRVNGFVELFIVRLRDEYLNEHLFRSCRHAREIIDEWRIDGNLHRPHASLDRLTPNQFATQSRADRNVNRAKL
jgi:putative transposase